MEKSEHEYRLPQMAVFDIDGTLTVPHSNSISQEVLEGLRHLRENGVITTVCTGRPYARMRDALGDNFGSVIDDKALIVIEHGAKIVDKHGIVKVESRFDATDVDKFIEFTGLNIDMVKCLIYNPSDLRKRSQVWVPEPSEADAIGKQRGSCADVFTGSLLDVKERLYAEPVSNVSLKLHDHIHVENLRLNFTGGSIKAVFQDGYLEYMKSKVSKARAVSYLCRYFGIYERNILVAGNAINDVDMLNMEVKYRVLVGPEGKDREVILGHLYGHEYIRFMDTPEDLGNFIRSL